MTEISYLERREEKDAFHGVKGVVDYFSNSVTSPFASTQGPGKKRVEFARDGSRQTSKMGVDARDDTTKRVVFHPNIVSSYSGEDLAFDSTKVYTYTYVPAESERQGNEEEERDGILSKTIAASKRNSNLPANQVYTGMSRRCRADLLKDDDSEINGDSPVTRIMKNHRKKQLIFKTDSAPTRPISTGSKNRSFLNELKENVKDDKDDDKDIQQLSKFTSRWQNQNQAAAKLLELETEGLVSDSAPMMTQNRLSPKKYSVSKISKARTGPVPKSDDFYSELKQWHRDYGLRQVEKPREITISTTNGDIVSSVEIDDKESKGNLKKKKFWKRKAQKPENTTVDVRKGDDDEAKKTDKSSKKKNYFWKISTKSKRKQKHKDASGSDGLQESVPLESQKSVPLNPTLGITQNPTKVPMKVPEETFVDTLSKFLELQSEMREDEDLAESDVCAEKCFPGEKARSAVLVETVHSTEGESSTVETPEPLEAQTAKSGQGETFSELMQTDSWLEKASKFFMKDDEANKESTDADVTEQDESTKLIVEVNETDEQEQGGKEEDTPVMENKPEQTKATEENDAWFGSITGFFNKDDTIDPPIMVVEVDKFEMDKYEAIAESEEADEGTVDSDKTKSMPDIETTDNGQDEVIHQIGTTTYEELMDEEEKDFPVPDCPCMLRNYHPDVEKHPDVERKLEIKTEPITDSQDKELSWLAMTVAGFFTPKQTEVQREEETSQTPKTLEGVQQGTLKASNRGFFPSGDDNDNASANEPEEGSSNSNREEPMSDQSDTFEGSIQTRTFDDSLNTPDDTAKDDSTNEGVAKSGTFEDSIITKEDNIQSNSFDDCVLTSEEGTKLTKIEPASPRMVSLLDLPENLSDLPENLSDLPENLSDLLENLSESQPCVDSPTTPKQSNTVTESPPCYDSSSISDFPLSIITKSNSDFTASGKKDKYCVMEEDEENKMSQAKDKKSTAAKNQKKNAEKSKKKEKVVGGTLFGRLDSTKKAKKQKKKTKKTSTLF